MISKIFAFKRTNRCFTALRTSPTCVLPKVTLSTHLVKSTLNTCSTLHNGLNAKYHGSNLLNSKSGNSTRSLKNGYNRNLSNAATTDDLKALEYRPTIYWRSGKQIRSGDISDSKLNISNAFYSDDFEHSDRIINVEGNVVYWTDNTGLQLRKGTISNGKLNQDHSYIYNFQKEDRIIQVGKNYIYWFGQKGNTTSLRRGRITGANEIWIDTAFNIDSFDTRDILLGIDNDRTLYWLDSNAKRIRRGSPQGGHLHPDHSFMFDGFDSSDSILGFDGDMIYWTGRNGASIRRGIIGKGTISIDTTFMFDGFNKEDRIIAIDPQRKIIYWTTNNGTQFRRGIVGKDTLYIDPSMMFNSFEVQDDILAIGNIGRLMRTTVSRSPYPENNTNKAAVNKGSSKMKNDTSAISPINNIYSVAIYGKPTIEINNTSSHRLPYLPEEGVYDETKHQIEPGQSSVIQIDALLIPHIFPDYALKVTDSCTKIDITNEKIILYCYGQNFPLSLEKQANTTGSTVKEYTLKLGSAITNQLPDSINNWLALAIQNLWGGLVKRGFTKDGRWDEMFDILEEVQKSTINASIPATVNNVTHVSPELDRRSHDFRKMDHDNYRAWERTRFEHLASRDSSSHGRTV